MRQWFFFTLLFFFIYVNAQVGIGNTDPKSSLDITASNVATPNNTDGILIPRIDNFPATNPAADQDGMLVFVTGNGTPAKGFYYWDNGVTSWVSVVGTKNTLNQAYNEGGAGAGKNIIADNGAIRIDGEDGFLVTGSFGSGDAIDTEVTGEGTRMFFNPRKAAFRAGYAEDARWDDTNIGDYSFAVNRRSMASGFGSVSLGYDSEAVGDHSFVMGNNSGASNSYSFIMGLNSYDYNNATFSFAFGNSAETRAPYSLAFGQTVDTYGDHSMAKGYQVTAKSYGETVFGFYNTDYTANSTDAYNATDRLFVLGNGIDFSNRSNALTIYKNGRMNINEAYNMPIIDGTNGQVMTTDGAGNITFQNAVNDNDWHEVGTTSSPNNINDNIFTQGNVGIGNTVPNASLDINYSGAQANAINIDYSQSVSTNAGIAQNITAESAAGLGIIGSGITVQNSGNSSITTGSAVMNTANGDNNAGFTAQVNGSGDNNIGISTLVSGASDENIGGFFTVTSAAIVNTGVFATASGGGTNWAGYFGNQAGNGNVYINDLLEVASAFRYTDGNETLGHILRTDASGNANWVSPNTVFTNTDNQNLAAASLIGTTLNLGIQNGTGTSVNLSTLQDGTGTDNQQIDTFNFNSANNILTLEIEDDGQVAQTVDLSSLQDNNTLNQAYDEGGAGAGRIINATDGAVQISGEDGFEITGAYGNGADLTLSGTGTRLFFNPKKAAFRAGHVDASQWDNTNIGNYSVSFGSNSQASGSSSTAFGRGTVASNSYTTAFGFNSLASGFIAVAFGDSTISSGSRATAFGSSTTASGVSSTAFGINNIAPSWAETTIGSYANIYTPISISGFNISDKVFSIGNGSVTLRSNALTIYKSGLMNINDEYNMPLTDGTNGQVMTTDGVGNVTFQNATINTDNQQIDTFSFNTTSNILTLELEDDAQVAQTVDLSSLQTLNTDNQHIDTFNFNSSTNILTLEIEDDGQVPVTVDLSSLNPQKAAAHITLNADQVTTGGGTTKVLFDTVGFDIGNNFNTTADEFTVPADGVYRISAQITVSSTTSTGIFNIRIRVDGSQVRIAGSNHSGNGSITRQINSLLELTAGQTIDISFQRATGVTINSNTSRSFFDIEQL